MVTSVTNNAQAPYDPTAASSSSSLTNGTLGKEDFLSLLVAQLSHQDPMSPTDPTQFVSQLSQFSSLEQLMNLKDGLDLLAVTQTAGTSAQMVSFIGKNVVYQGSEVSWHAGDEATSAQFQLAAKADSVSVTIRDAHGDAVNEYELGQLGAGDHAAPFSGVDKDGKPLPDGQYTVEISAKDADGNSIKVTQLATGRVAGVTFEHGYPEIILDDGRTLALGQVMKVVAEAPASAPLATPLPDGPEDTGAVSSAPQLPFPTTSKTQKPGRAATTLSTPWSHPRR